MLHHLSFAVTDLQQSASFYDATLAVLGYGRVWSTAAAVGYGPPDEGDKFAIKARGAGLSPPKQGFHLAFTAPNRKAVDDWHAAALALGATDRGAPGLRPHYGPHYYAAFVLDPDGYWLEAVINSDVES